MSKPKTSRRHDSHQPRKGVIFSADHLPTAPPTRVSPRGASSSRSPSPSGELSGRSRAQLSASTSSIPGHGDASDDFSASSSSSWMRSPRYDKDSIVARRPGLRDRTSPTSRSAGASRRSPSPRVRDELRKSNSSTPLPRLAVEPPPPSPPAASRTTTTARRKKERGLGFLATLTKRGRNAGSAVAASSSSLAVDTSLTSLSAGTLGGNEVFTTLSIQQSTSAATSEESESSSHRSRSRRQRLRRSSSITHSILLQSNLCVLDDATAAAAAADDGEPVARPGSPSSQRPNLQTFGRKSGQRNLATMFDSAPSVFRKDLDVIDAHDQRFDQPPLLLACETNSLQSVQSLLADSRVAADLNAVDCFGWSALHYAAHRGNLPICHALLSAGIDASLATSDNDENALHMIAKHGYAVDATPLYAQVLEAMYRNGARPSHKNRMRESVWYVLLCHNGKDAAAFLQQLCSPDNSPVKDAPPPSPPHPDRAALALSSSSSSPPPPLLTDAAASASRSRRRSPGSGRRSKSRGRSKRRSAAAADPDAIQGDAAAPTSRQVSCSPPKSGNSLERSASSRSRPRLKVVKKKSKRAKLSQSSVHGESTPAPDSGAGLSLSLPPARHRSKSLSAHDVRSPTAVDPRLLDLQLLAACTSVPAASKAYSDDMRLSLLNGPRLLPSIFSDAKASAKTAKQGFQPVHKLLQRILNDRDLKAFPEFVDELLSMFPLFATPEEMFHRLAAMFDNVPSLVSKLSLTSLKTRTFHDKILKRRTNIVDLVRRFVLFFAEPLQLSDALLADIHDWVLAVSNEHDENFDELLDLSSSSAIGRQALMPFGACGDLAAAVEQAQTLRRAGGRDVESNSNGEHRTSRLLLPNEPLAAFDRFTVQTLAQQLASALHGLLCNISVSELCSFVGLVRKHLHAPEMGLFGEVAAVKAQETVSTTATVRLVGYCHQLVLRHHGRYGSVQAHLRFVTRLRHWVIGQILSQTDLQLRTRTLEIWIRVAHVCLAAGVPECCSAIVDGLCHPSVERLSRTWRALSSRARSLFAEISDEIQSRRKYSLHVVQTSSRAGAKQHHDEWDLFRFTFELASCVSDSSLFTSRSADALAGLGAAVPSSGISLVCVDYARARSVLIRFRALQAAAAAAAAATATLSTAGESTSGDGLNVLATGGGGGGGGGGNESLRRPSFLMSARQMMAGRSRLEADSLSLVRSLSSSSMMGFSLQPSEAVAHALDALGPPQVQLVLDALPLLPETLLSALSLSCEAQEKPHGPRSVVMNIIERNIVYVVNDGEISIQSASLSKILENLTLVGAAVDEEQQQEQPDAQAVLPSSGSEMVLGTGFVSNFLLMYERFISHVELLRYLRACFEQTSPDSIAAFPDRSCSAALHDELLQNARSRRRAILEALKRLLRYRYHDLRQDRAFTGLLLDWLRAVRPMNDEEVFFFTSLRQYFVRPRFYSVVAQQQSLADSSFIVGRMFVDRLESSYLVLQKPFPREAAEQLCLIDFDMFAGLSPTDLLPASQPAASAAASSLSSLSASSSYAAASSSSSLLLSPAAAVSSPAGDLPRAVSSSELGGNDTPDCEPRDRSSVIAVTASTDVDLAALSTSPLSTPSRAAVPRLRTRQTLPAVAEPERARIRITARFNGLSMWTAQTVLSFEQLETRALALQQLIGLSWKCMRLNNFNASFAILSGLNSGPIIRLKRTFALLSSKWKNRLRTLDSLFDYRKSHKNYRTHLKTVHPPLVPFLGLVTKDIFAIDQNNADVLDSGLINFEKFALMGRVIRDSFQYQAVGYTQLSPDPVLQQFLINIVSPKFVDPDYVEQLQETLYQTSSLLEPAAGASPAAAAAAERPPPARSVNRSPRRKHVIEASSQRSPPIDIHLAALSSSSAAVRRHLTSMARSVGPDSELSSTVETPRSLSNSLSSSLIGSRLFGRKKSLPDITSPSKFFDVDLARFGDASASPRRATSSTPRNAGPESPLPADDSNS